jgi:serine/threonine protein kinase
LPLTPGTRLGPYEILAPLGAGGMGEVYRARDARLGREVAIKLLPEAVASDPDRLFRFEQEARSASALNHPNIVTIYDVGQVDSVSYIAMELVQGKTLRDLLAEGPLTAKRLLSLAGQIADALARAHEAGIVHRDLKPENLMVTREGFVKILDFGLAKLIAPEGSEVSQLPTAAEGTRPGLVLGTVGYMSPEQASGKPVGFRSDQFSLGSILYEMATGKRAFSGATTAETLVAIIREEPEPLGSLVPQVPVALRWVVERCLAKDPEERYASTRDLARDLAHLRDHVSEVSQGLLAVTPPRRRRLSSWALAGGWLLAAALAVFAALRLRHEPVGHPVRLAIPLPPGTSYAPPEVSRGVSISPDGTRAVIEAVSKGRRHLYLRALDSEESGELEGSIDATSHFWSPDGRFLAFFADGKLKKIPATGGHPEELCDAPFALVGTWNKTGTILFSKLDPPGIYSVSDGGGEAVRITTPDRGRQGDTPIWPHFLPDGRRFLYLVNRAPGTGSPRELRVASLDSKENRAVTTRIASRVEYVPPGFLVYVREGALFTQRFDDRSARLSGEPQQLAENVHYFFGPSLAVFSTSQTGALAYQMAAGPSRLVWFDRKGKEIGQLGAPSLVKGMRISPDGGSAAAAIGDPRWGTSDIWVFDASRGISTRLHSDPVDEMMPVWSADGSKVLYRSDRKGPPDIYEIAVGVPGSEKPVLALPGLQQPEDVSQDGRLLAYLQEVASTVWNIWLLPLEGERKPSSWHRTRFNESSPRFSPDGRWIAYESNESGDPEIYVALTNGGGEKRRISPGGGRRPRWRRDGKELYYSGRGGVVMAVPVTPGSRWESGAPVPIFRVEPEIEDYDVAPDGSRFLVVLPLEKVRESPLRVILNWTAAMKRP